MSRHKWLDFDRIMHAAQRTGYLRQDQWEMLSDLIAARIDGEGSTDTLDWTVLTDTACEVLCANEIDPDYHGVPDTYPPFSTLCRQTLDAIERSLA